MVHFINISKLKDLGFIHDNVDTKTLKTCITRAQDINIQQALGTPLYKKMMELASLAISGTPVTGVYKIILEEKIQPALTCWTDVRASIHLLTKLTNKTVGKNTDEYIKHVDDIKSNKAIKQTLESDADFYTARLIAYLKENCNDIPEYGSAENGDVKPYKKKYRNPFY